MKAVINGAGIAGAALAWWLSRDGHEVLLVERAPQLRTGGYLLDLWGTGYDVAERMGLLPAFHQRQYQVDELRLVDRNGRRCGGYPASVLSDLAGGRFMALARSDVVRGIHDLLDDRVETVFGDTIAAIDQRESRVRVSFERGPDREVDLVIGADGLHSRVRALAFGPESRYRVDLGCHVAAFEAGGYDLGEHSGYAALAAPGLYVSRFPVRGGRTLFFILFRDDKVAGVTLSGEQACKAILERVLVAAGWECPRIAAALDAADSVYYDSVSQIRMDRWTRGRVALVGDAAACPSLMAGEGAGFALLEARVLAGELHRHAGDCARVFARYERLLMPFLARKQQAAVRIIPSFIPKTRPGVAARNAATSLMRVPLLAKFLMGKFMCDDIELPDDPI